MQTKRIIDIISALVCAAAVLALPSCGKDKAGNPAQGGRPAPEVSVIDIRPEKVTIVNELSGRVSAFLVAEVRPQVGGIIQQVLFTEGSEVGEGDVLYQIDPSIYKADYESAKASLARAEAILPPARSKAERYRELVAANAISRQEYDDADAAAKKAEADLLSAKAAVERARINLAYTRVKAPITGRIGKSSVTTGALVTGFQAQALAVIQKLDPVYVDVTQSSTEMLKMKQSLANGLLTRTGVNEAGVRLMLEDGSVYDLPGVLKFSDVTVDTGTGSVILRSVFPNPELTLLPGMFVRALVEEGVNENAVLVPQRCVTRNTKGQPEALVVNDKGLVESRLLTIDRAVGTRWLIKDGLTEGDRVIVEGLQKVRPGAAAKTVPFTGKSDTAQSNVSGAEK
ncbi:efflux RND transporter periplasmic adaptor subunit [Desulfatiferula olefinivorans]